MTINGVECTFHHMGIPTAEKHPNERYSERFKMYTSDSDCQTIRVQWHRFEPGSSMHPLMQNMPHVTFKVEDLERAIRGYNVILGPYEPIPEYFVAVIEDGGQPIELIQTALSDNQVWQRATSGLGTVLYETSGEKQL